MTSLGNNNTIKRLTNEYRLVKKAPLEDFDVYVEEKDLHTWHFLLKGSKDTPYYGGTYIGKLLFGKNYPDSSIDVEMLTPSGRFDINKKICLSNTNYHPEEKTVLWNGKTFLTGFLSIMNDSKEKGLNHIHKPADECKILAKESFDYNVKNHLDILQKFNRFIGIRDDKDGNKEFYLK